MIILLIYPLVIVQKYMVLLLCYIRAIRQGIKDIEKCNSQEDIEKLKQSLKSFNYRERALAYIPLSILIVTAVGMFQTLILFIIPPCVLVIPICLIHSLQLKKSFNLKTEAKRKEFKQYV